MNDVMVLFCWIIATIGVLGFIASTLLFPFIVSLRKPPSPLIPLRFKREYPVTLRVIIPAYNEESTIHLTIQSVQKALNALKPFLSYEIIVGDDGSTDRTRTLALDGGAKVVSFPHRMGKWKILCHLSLNEEHQAQWCVFVDASTYWPTTLGSEIFPMFENENVMCVSPTYIPAAKKSLAHWIWAWERWIKNIESRAGGPVSVHGATVFYRSRELLPVLRSLQKQEWLNDDIIIPLTLRRSYPHLKIAYVSDIERGVYIADLGMSKNSVRKRTHRIIYGNVQWMQDLTTHVSTSSYIVTLISLRRVFRVFWGYWVGCIVMAVLGALTLQFGVMISFMLTIAMFSLVLFAFMLIPEVSRLAHAWLGSLSAPFYFFKKPKQIEWG